MSDNDHEVRSMQKLEGREAASNDVSTDRMCFRKESMPLSSNVSMTRTFLTIPPETFDRGPKRSLSYCCIMSVVVLSVLSSSIALANAH